ncbi:serine hydrolase domain-containing protein [Nonomuraea typhae]|uniref:Serine hydrolase domain-containing protein n=1 Tax=Nonomuraea typhae TaxID=2603600 RepID=A0ABW7YYE2_9ACTN
MKWLSAGVVALVMLAACAPADPFPEGFDGTVLVARGDRIASCRGSCDTAYDIMSITKQFTAAAILKLETMGRLRTGEPISAYLGPVPEDKRRIAVHHLLTHTAGLVEGLGADYEPVTRDAMLAGALGSRLVAAPGKEFHYSNLGYSVLAAIVEKVSGLGYERFLARHLFAPAGMGSTGYVLPRWSRVAVEYDGQGNSVGRPYEHPWAADGPYWNLRGNGGMLSTARDMFRWHRALTGDAVLPAGARARLFTPYVPTQEPGESYAYGWNILRRAAWHDGGNDWSAASFARSLDGEAMVFWVTNRAQRWKLEEREPDLTLGLLR